MDYFVLSQIIRYSLIQFVVLYRGLGILPCMGWETPCSMRAMPRLPCPSFYLPEYTSHSDWLHHNNLTYIVILNYILSSEQQNRPSQQGNAPTHGVGACMQLGVYQQPYMDGCCIVL